MSDVAVIGRENCDWSLPDPSRRISDRHCSITRRGNRYVLRDLSANGTFLNGSAERIDGEAILQDGARIGIGAYDIKVAYLDDAPATQTKSLAVEKTANGPAAFAGAVVRNLDPAEAVARLSTALAGNRSPQTRILETGAATPAPASLQESRAAPTIVNPVAGPELAPAPANEEVTQVTDTVDEPGADDATRARAAAGLGVPVAALAELDLGDLVEELGRVVRLSAESVRGRYANWAAANRRLRRRDRQKVRDRIFNPLQSRDPDRSLALLLAAEHARPGALSTFFEASATELDSQFERFQQAVAESVRLLAEEIEPDMLEQACRDRPSQARRREAAWEMYRSAWSDLHDDWQNGFAEAFDHNLAEALRPVD
ncbi:type VI secretion system-associated FHA domain protein TagH [Rhodobacterales bacterium HKCCE3408]|nr:type VI secretion system-associated FHA domain protein TagH [Rhodobacterales bacterium HKCCE3408]